MVLHEAEAKHEEEEPQAAAPTDEEPEEEKYVALTAEEPKDVAAAPSAQPPSAVEQDLEKSLETVERSQGKLLCSSEVSVASCYCMSGSLGSR